MRKVKIGREAKRVRKRESERLKDDRWTYRETKRQIDRKREKLFL